MSQVCSVCGEPLDPDHWSRCFFCGGCFHMPWSVNVKTRQCGSYMLHQQSCGLVFVCSLCEARLSAGTDQPNQPNTSSGT